MSYVHWAVAHIKDSDGRSLNLTETPTITAYNIVTEAAIASPAASLVNLVTGLYKVKITLDDITKVAFKVVPHTDDQSAVADIAMLDDGVVHVADEILTDTGTTLPATLATIQGADGDTMEDLSDQLDAILTIAPFGVIVQAELVESTTENPDIEGETTPDDELEGS